MSGESGFVVKRLRAKPVEYTVGISHFVREGKWVMGVSVRDITEDRENLLRVAADLRAAAQWIEEDYGAPPAEDNTIPPTPKACQYCGKTTECDCYGKLV